jgi:hypothetical protein
MERVLTLEERDKVLLGSWKCPVDVASRKVSEISNRPAERNGVTRAGRIASEDLVALAVMLGAAARRYQK